MAVPPYEFDRSNKIKPKHFKRFKKIIRPDQFAQFMRRHTFVRGHHNRPGKLKTWNNRKRGIILSDDIKLGSPAYWNSKPDEKGRGTVIDVPDLLKLDQLDERADSSFSDAWSNYSLSEDEPENMFLQFD